MSRINIQFVNNMTTRAVGFVNYDARGSRDNKRACGIFLHKEDDTIGSPKNAAGAAAAAASSGSSSPAASPPGSKGGGGGGGSRCAIVLHGLASRFELRLCSIPISVTQHWIQQIHMSTTGEYVCFTVADAQNPESTPKPPMLFHRTGSDLRPCDHYVDHGKDLGGDVLLSYYFPQFTNVGDMGATWVVAACRPQAGGVRTVHLVKLQHPDKQGFFGSFSIFKKARKISAHQVKMIPGTDLVLTSTHKMAPGYNVPVKHFAVHAVTASESITRLFEVQLERDLSMASASEQLLGGYVFFEGGAQEEMKFARDAVAAGKNAVASPRFNCVVVANIMYDQAVKSSVCGAQPRDLSGGATASTTNIVAAAAAAAAQSGPTPSHVSGLSSANSSERSAKKPAAAAAYPQRMHTPEYVLMNVVRLFVFRPRGTYQGQDYYIDLYFERRNLAVFQLSALGQMVVLSPGYKAYFVDVKYFHPDVGPSVSCRLYLDGHYVPNANVGSALPPRVRAVSTLGHLESGGGGVAPNGNTQRYFDNTSGANLTRHDSTDDDLMSPALSGGVGVVVTPPAESGAATAAAAASAAPHHALPFEEAPFLGDWLPDCFLRINCVPARLPPMEIPCGERGRHVLFFSTHTPAVLSLESRTPVWIAAQQALLRDRLRRPMHPLDRCHDGEFTARGLLSVMDRVVMSLAGKASATGGGSSSAAASPASATGSPAFISSGAGGAGNNGSFSARAGYPQDRARAALDEDTLWAKHALVPLFRCCVTRMRDPVGLCVEWILAAAYFRLGFRHSAPPRLAFDLTAYEGLLHPHGLPRTTQHVRGTTIPMTTYLVDCAGCAASSGMSAGGVGGASSAARASENSGAVLPGWSVRVSPRDELVKAIENRLEDGLPGRETLIREFREFGAYEEEILELICPSLLNDVRMQLFPATTSLIGASNPSRISSKEFKSVSQRRMSSSGGAVVDVPDSPAALQKRYTPRGPLARRVPSVTPALQRVNELSFLLCRLTALEIIGVRLDRERAAPVFSTTIVFFAAEHRVLPFNALCRGLWTRAITCPTDQTANVLMAPMSQFANLENNRLNVLVTQGAHVRQRRRRFMPSVNPTGVALAPLGSGSGLAAANGGGRGMSWSPSAAEQMGWDDDFSAAIHSRSAKKFLRRIRKRFPNDPKSA